MTPFARSFDVEAAIEQSPPWWNDLLRLWCPAGTPVGPAGLRLAIRAGYLNFYRKGQSVARVGFDADGGLFASIHFKYAFPDSPSAKSSPYLRLEGSVVRRKRDKLRDYEGAETLSGWIARAERKAGHEKRFIDDVLDLSPDVIDLEMGLSRKDIPHSPSINPDEEPKQSALRMDIVCVHPSPSGLALTFWEAKRASDARVRCRGELDRQNHRPEVLRQLDDYRAFVESPGNADRIASAYRETAVALSRLRAHANTLGVVCHLGEAVRAAALEPFAVNANARLVIFRDKHVDNGWDSQHEPRLREAGISMAVWRHPAALNFASA
jgi:hypothetical protein